MYGRGVKVVSPGLAGPMIPVYAGRDVLPPDLATGARKLPPERVR